MSYLNSVMKHTIAPPLEALQPPLKKPDLSGGIRIFSPTAPPLGDIATAPLKYELWRPLLDEENDLQDANTALEAEMASIMASVVKAANIVTEVDITTKEGRDQVLLQLAEHTQTEEATLDERAKEVSRLTDEAKGFAKSMLKLADIHDEQLDAPDKKKDAVQRAEATVKGQQAEREKSIGEVEALTEEVQGLTKEM
jgi:hypothetical protein